MARKHENASVSKQPTAAKRSSARREANKGVGQAKPTKKQACLGLLRRSKGATIVELAKATGWQAHSVRGFLSGTVKKLEGVTLVTDCESGKVRRYRITQAKAG